MTDKHKAILYEIFGQDMDDVLSSRISVFLFGMGLYAIHQVLPVLNRIGVPIKGVADNDSKKSGKYYRKIKILSFDQLKAVAQKDIIIISSLAHEKQIRNQLSCGGFYKILTLQEHVFKQMEPLLPKELAFPLQAYVCSICPTNCTSCCYREFRERNPWFHLAYEDIDDLNKALIKYHIAVSIQFVGGETLLWRNLTDSVHLLSNNWNIRRIELTTAGTKKQIEILDPIIDMVDCIHFSKYKSNQAYADELSHRYGDKVIVHDIPCHMAMNKTIYPLRYPVTCACPNLAYYDHDLWLCPWVPLNGEFLFPSLMNHYRGSIHDVLQNGIPKHWVHGTHKDICDLCTANLARQQYAEMVATP